MTVNFQALVQNRCGVTVPKQIAHQFVQSGACPNQLSSARSLRWPMSVACQQGLGDAVQDLIASVHRTQVMRTLPNGSVPAGSPVNKTVPPMMTAQPAIMQVPNQAGAVQGPLPGANVLNVIERNWMLIGGLLLGLLVLSQLNKGKGRRRR